MEFDVCLAQTRRETGLTIALGMRPGTYTTSHEDVAKGPRDAALSG